MQVPFAVAADADNLYISDWGLNAVVAVYKNGTVENIIDHVNQPSGLLFTARTTGDQGIVKLQNNK